MEEITVLPRDLCIGDIVTGLEDGKERVVKDVWYTTGFPALWDGKIYPGGYSIDFDDREWLIHAHDRPLKIKRKTLSTSDNKSAVSMFYLADLRKRIKKKRNTRIA